MGGDIILVIVIIILLFYVAVVTIMAANNCYRSLIRGRLVAARNILTITGATLLSLAVLSLIILPIMLYSKNNMVVNSSLAYINILTVASVILFILLLASYFLLDRWTSDGNVHAASVQIISALFTLIGTIILLAVMIITIYRHPLLANDPSPAPPPTTAVFTNNLSPTNPLI